MVFWDPILGTSMLPSKLYMKRKLKSGIEPNFALKTSSIRCGVLNTVKCMFLFIGIFNVSKVLEILN